MANPKKRKTHSASAKGRSHLALKKVSLSRCPKCKKMKRPHTVCQSCGYYRGKEIIKPVVKAGAKVSAQSASRKTQEKIKK